MSIRELYNHNVLTISPRTTVLEAARLMKQKHRGSLIVVEWTRELEKPIGIITDRDIVRHVVANEVPPTQTLVENVMTANLRVIPEDTGLMDAMKTMRELGIRRIPVVRKNGTLCGILAIDDILGVLAKELNQIASVSGQAMKREIRETLVG